jgi:hypothetical protein
MPTPSTATKRLTTVAIACAGALWGFAGITRTHAGCPTSDAENAKVTILRGIDEDAALAATAGPGLAGTLIYDQRSEPRAYWYYEGYLAGRTGRPPLPPLVSPLTHPVPVTAVQPLAPPAVPPPPPPP